MEQEAKLKEQEWVCNELREEERLRKRERAPRRRQRKDVVTRLENGHGILRTTKFMVYLAMYLNLRNSVAMYRNFSYSVALYLHFRCTVANLFSRLIDLCLLKVVF